MTPKETKCKSCDGEGVIFEGDDLIQCPDCGGTGFIDEEIEEAESEEEE